MMQWVKILMISVLVCLSLITHGQASVSLTTAKDTTQVGEVITLKYQINAPLQDIETIDFSPLFDIDNLVYDQDTNRLEKTLDVSIIDGSSIAVNNQNLIIQGTQLTSQSGEIKVAFYSFGIGDVNNPIVKLKDGTEARPLQRSRLFVLPPASFQQMMDSLQLMDIKPIMEEGSHWTDFLFLLYGLIGIVIAYLLYNFIKSRQVDTQAEVEQEEIIVIPAHEKALAALQSLNESQLWQSGDIKGYQSSLTRIMREYIEDRYDVPALEMTSSQLKTSLKKLNIEDTLIQKMNDILQIADVVKFAKGTAGPELNQKFMDYAYEWVNTTKVVEVIE